MLVPVPSRFTLFVSYSWKSAGCGAAWWSREGRREPALPSQSRRVLLRVPRTTSSGFGAAVTHGVLAPAAESWRGAQSVSSLLCELPPSLKPLRDNCRGEVKRALWQSAPVGNQVRLCSCAACRWRRPTGLVLLFSFRFQQRDQQE